MFLKSTISHINLTQYRQLSIVYVTTGNLFLAVEHLTLDDKTI